MSEPTSTETQLVNYTVHENGIHEFAYNVSSRQGFADSLAMLEEIFQRSQDEKQLSMLYDFSVSGFPPISGSFQQLQAVLKRYPKHPVSRVAILHNSSGALLTIFETFSNMLRLTGQDTIRYFPVKQREAAIAWLLES